MSRPYRPIRARGPVASLAALCALLALGCPSDTQRAERAREAAREAVAKGDMPALREALAELRDSRSESPEALIELTTLMSMAGEAPQAVWLLEEGLARFPDRDDLRLELARVALIVSNPMLARSAVSSIEAGSEHHLDALLVRARAEFELGNLDGGLAILVEAEELYPDEPRVGIARVATLIREQRLEDASAAIEDLRERLGEGDEARSLELAAARIQAAQGDEEGALLRMRALVDADPTDAVALQLLVTGLARAGELDEALERAQAAVEQSPEDASLWAVLAQVRLRNGEFDEAERAIRSAVDASESPSSYMLLAQFYQQRDLPERAAETFAEAADRFPDAAMLRMHHAESLVEMDRIDAARRQLDEFRVASPDDPHVEYLRGRIELAEGNPGGAARRLGKVVSRLDRAYTQYWLGRALESMGDVTGAERRYGLALLRGGANPAPAIALLSLAERRGDWEAVATRALQLVQRSPGSSEGYETAISALVRTGRADAAEELARRYQERFSDDPQAAALLAMSLRAQGRLDEAGKVLDAAQAASGGTSSLEIERGMLEGSRGRFAEGIATLEAVLAEEPDNQRAHAVLAALHFGAGDGDAGSAAVDRAISLDQEDAAPLVLRARYLASRGELDRALADCDQYLELRPRDASVHFMRGVILAGRDEPERAVRAYRRAIELDESAVAAHNNLALLLAEQGELPAALEVAQKAYALAEDDANVVDTLGWLYLKDGLVERSAALLERARELDPEAQAPQLHLAIAYRELGRDDEAAALLRGLLREVDETSPLGVEASEALRSLGP